MTYEHPGHAPSNEPIAGCDECDKAANKPIRRGFGDGYGSTVVPRPHKDSGDER